MAPAGAGGGRTPRPAARRAAALALLRRAVRPAACAAAATGAPGPLEIPGSSLIGSLRSGSALLDMLLAMLVPVFIRCVLGIDLASLLQQALEPLRGILWRPAYVRVIEYTEGGNTRVRFNPFLEDSQNVVDNTDRNNLLHKAIRLYMAEKYGMEAAEMEACLVPTRKIKMESKSDQFGGQRSSFSGSYQQLLAFAVQRMPKRGEWIEVDRERGIWFMQTVNEQQTPGASADNAVVVTKTSFHIKGTGRGAGETVNAWIREAFDWYREQKRHEEDHSRFFYVAVPGDGKESKPGKSALKYQFKQYLLSDQKTFESLFFPEKEQLLRLIDQFTRKEGKFAIEGFPDKLGLLLDGPPGTGKTSLIKALAHHLNRHVVSVNLARIKTNQELMDLLFDLVFPVQGGDFPIKMKFSDLIFVMEDVDAASKVVYARKGSKAAAKAKAAKAKAKASGASAEAAASAPPAADAAPEAERGDATRSAPPPMPTLLRMVSGNLGAKGSEAEGTAAAKETTDESEEDEGAEDDEQSSRAEAKKAENMVGEILCKMIGGGGGTSSDAEDGPGKKSSKMVGFAGPYNKASYNADDDLNLAGLLNVLDGVVDSPGRVVVMTTNHPDKLDPALIRPGRINKRIHLGFVQGEAVCAMAEHYMQAQLSSEQRWRLTELVTQRSVTPAQVEQCCAEGSDVEDFCAYLAKLK